MKNRNTSHQILKIQNAINNVGNLYDNYSDEMIGIDDEIGILNKSSKKINTKKNKMRE